MARLRHVVLCGLMACAATEPASPRPTRGSSSHSDEASPLIAPESAVQPQSARDVPAQTIARAGADNPAGLSPEEIAALKAGGPPGQVQWLYPYDGTVFPRGLLPPTLMWSGAETADAAYIRLRARRFAYEGVLKTSVDPATRMPSVTLPDDVWTEAGRHSLGKGDPFTLELSLRANGASLGPLRLQLVIAQATVKGSIYYNSYASKLPGAALGGNVLRIPSGGQAELYTSMQCNGCHALSADGSTMLSQIELQAGGSAFRLVSGGPPNPPSTPVGPRVSFAALYPDGSKYLSTTVSVDVAHAQIAEPDASPPEAALYNTATGAIVPNTGIPGSAAMPMFSPDGTRLVFTDASVDGADALAVMEYDMGADRASQYRVLMRDAEATRPGWPFFLPDGNAIVFVRTESADFSGNGAYIGAGMFASLAGPFAALASAPVPGPRSDLYIADIESGTVTLLARAMGFQTPQDATDATQQRTSLPFADDTHQSYFPTVAPIAAGGYFWVFFDGIRHYGNRGIQRQLWGFAIDIQASGRYVEDHSHPAFYLPGQEPGAGNHRAFAALDPCKPTGDSCSSGVDCCGGACRIPDAAGEQAEPLGTCEPRQTECAKRDERCQSDSDCCTPEPGQPADWCIAGFCAYVPLE